MDRHPSAASVTAAAVASLRALLLTCLFSLCLCSVAAIPSVPVESFSLSDVTENRGDTVLELVAALETRGILSLREVPAYAETRARFLKVATECTALSGVVGVQSKTLRDGTTRRTISTKSQLHNPSLAHSTVEKDCPRYLPELRAFSELLNVVALRLARAIDGALKTSPSSHTNTEKLEGIVTSAQHLDHFHAYSSPRSDPKPTVNEDADEDQENAVLSLDLHTDNGIMILMTTPEFYALRDGHTPTRVSRDKITSGAQASAGLLIQQPRQHHVVQPVLMDDELIVMIGEGYKAWMYSTLDFKAVLHGMQMPQFSPALGQISRSWFGKMILLPRDRHMKNLGLTFEEYSERATSFVVHGQQKGTTAFSAVACPPDSRPVASDKACALQLYEPLPDARSSRDECMSLCNTHNDEECQALCAYVATVPRGGVDCWMLCLPNDRCKNDEIAQCDPSGKQQTVCVASPLV